MLTEASASLELFPPSPVHSIVPYSAPNLPMLQKKKLLILRKRIILLQRELLAKSFNKCVSSGQGCGEKLESSNSTSCTLSSPLTGFEVNWVFDDACLIRFLQARNWQVGKALYLLIESIQFRRKYKPERIRPKDIQKVSRGQIYRRGFDVHGYPIIFIRPSLSDPEDDPDLALKLLLYILERATQSMERSQGICKFSFVVDYNGYTAANQPPLNLSLKFLDIFQNYYPETLEVVFFLDTPWYFQIPSALLDFKFSPQYKGAYDHKAYWIAENKQFEGFMKFLQCQFIEKNQTERLEEITREVAASSKQNAHQLLKHSMLYSNRE
ncbi:CRAL/TRIO domain-containing protein [Cardiosporidium cionae]|uniref:CRAL/TRIO domain-containing protein n=1 Tax=Cardiosporidium cionae TaxID=476202 RepID=A0ABQ7JB93_9APIC|nr:CRAL/TRIO domain-containing protein [Cardiosporidium cionae]|eukprot:KAF8821259.1 CRAL/TRIO domain-containing protein [Cardiosporidium cionae]